jgi:isorenieratene synthase
MRRVRRVDEPVPHAGARVDTTTGPFRVAVVGGGLAGSAATTVLAERGATVTLFEREEVLGGRLAGWPDRLATGERVEMERGFHAFFRQYHNVRNLLRRADPGLRGLRPVTDPVRPVDRARRTGAWWSGPARSTQPDLKGHPSSS